MNEIILECQELLRKHFDRRLLECESTKELETKVQNFIDSFESFCVGKDFYVELMEKSKEISDIECLFIETEMDGILEDISYVIFDSFLEEIN